jgi:hypothetical protein
MEGVENLEKPSTAEEFRELAEFEPPELVKLPSGARAMLRRPRPLYFVRARKQVPQSGAARVQGAQASQPSDEELATIIKFWCSVWKDIFVSPRIAENPGPGEIGFAWLRADDTSFLIRWAVGEVASNGSDLAAFRDGEAGGRPAVVRPGADVPRDAPQPVPA